jgi:hypothetical protein
MTAKLDADEVRRALSTREVLSFYQWPTKKSGRDLESKACPRRLDHSRRALVITPSNGLWHCHACDYGGDLFTFIAEVERLRLSTDFPAVLAKAAEIAGVTPSTMTDAERAARREEWRKEREAEEERERREKAERDAAAVPYATGYWDALLPAHKRGVEYLLERRVGDVVQFEDCVRFDPKHSGSPSIALYSSVGEIRNVVARRVPELVAADIAADLDEKKAVGLFNCPTAGTLINAACQIERERDVVLTEGVMDSITARVAWPSAIVLGAHGVGNLPKIARVAAPACAKAKTRLLLVPHLDKSGIARAREACITALDAGLSIRKGTLRIVKTGEKDLNDAWGRGWRPAA